MSKRECSDCRENEKTFKNNMNYKCRNEHCENYISPIVKEVISQDENEYSKDKQILELLNKLLDKESEILNLQKQINNLKYEVGCLKRNKK